MKTIALIFLTIVTLACCFGCATPGVQCGMKDNYQHVMPVADSGTVTIHWQYGPKPRQGVYGLTTCHYKIGLGQECFIALEGPAPTANDVCGLAKIGHEVGHAMLMEHEQPR